MPIDLGDVVESVSGHPSERRRALTSAVVGLAAGCGVGFVAPWQVAVLTAWDVAAVVMLGWVWLGIHALDATQTRALARREDNSRVATRVILLLAAVASLFGVGFALVATKRISGGFDVLLTVESIATVVLSWALVHLVYMLRYAHIYYEGDPGGVEFRGDESPDYGEFAYLAFTIGMTYQVSDTDVTTRRFRRALLGHALLSYLFGTIIVALTINVVAGLVG